MLPTIPKLKLGIALGGGSARGLSQIGVLEVLEESGIHPDVIAGTSMGALIGAIYLYSGKPAGWLKGRLKEFMQSEVFQKARFDLLRDSKDEDEEGFWDSISQRVRRGIMYSYSVRRESIIPREVFEGIIEGLIPDIKIEELPKPFAAVSLDVNSGEEVIWTKGSLRKAVMASSAIPGFFPPQMLDRQILVDGGWTNSVPIRPALALGADVVIAVDTSRGTEELFEFKRGLDLIIRTAQIMMKKLREVQLEEADVVIQPAVMDIHWADFANTDLIIELGRKAAESKIKDIRSAIRHGWRKRVLKDALDLAKIYQKILPERSEQ